MIVAFRFAWWLQCQTKHRVFCAADTLKYHEKSRAQRKASNNLTSSIPSPRASFGCGADPSGYRLTQHDRIGEYLQSSIQRRIWLPGLNVWFLLLWAGTAACNDWGGRRGETVIAPSINSSSSSHQTLPARPVAKILEVIVRTFGYIGLVWTGQTAHCWW